MKSPHNPLNLIAIICVVVAHCSSAQVVAKDPLPNIVFMFADDLGYGDLGCYGHPYARTPNLDQMAAEGTRFSQFYVTGVTCNPSRTGLMTGIYPARYPKYAADFGFGDRATITELLNEHGYRTGHFGKWHIGPDDSAGIYGLETIDVISGDHDDPEGRDTRLFKAAERFIRDNKDEPFYVNIWGHSTHFPVHVTDSLAQEFADEKVDRSSFSETMQHKFDQCLEIGGDLDDSMDQYLADVYSLDLNVGRIMKVLDDLGLSENTILVFSSDHGPAPVALGKKGVREYSNNMLGYAGELRGGKHELYEGGTRVPFIVRWPGHIKAGRVDEENVLSFIDWLPTLAKIAGIESIPMDLDGEDTSDIWMGESRERSSPLFWKVSSNGAMPVMRDGNWKLHLPGKRGATAELYDLSKDPSESNNLAEKFPEVLSEMKAKLQAWNEELPTSYEKAGRGKSED